MDDMTTFERQLADGFKGLMGPSQPVDDAAILAAISTTRSTKWRFRAVFSATRFVAAAAIVALFGGFAIMGIVSIRQTDQPAPGAASPSPMTTQDLLSGMVTEEVEPGVFRVDSDGIRPLSRPIGTGYKGVTIDFEMIQDGMGGDHRGRPRWVGLVVRPDRLLPSRRTRGARMAERASGHRLRPTQPE